MSRISKVIGREILDSRGNPTVEADVILESGNMGRAAAPSGASTGEREAIELRDGDNNRYLGKGVTRAVSHINQELAGITVGRDCNDQRGLDQAFRADRQRAHCDADAIVERRIRQDPSAGHLDQQGGVSDVTDTKIVVRPLVWRQRPGWRRCGRVGNTHAGDQQQGGDEVPACSHTSIMRCAQLGAR